MHTAQSFPGMSQKATEEGEGVPCLAPRLRIRLQQSSLLHQGVTRCGPHPPHPLATPLPRPTSLQLSSVTPIQFLNLQSFNICQYSISNAASIRAHITTQWRARQLILNSILNLQRCFHSGSHYHIMACTIADTELLNSTFSKPSTVKKASHKTY